MTITFYRSTDTSAPTLTGQVGSLTTLLDAILVNGYGSQPAAGWTIAYTGTNQRDYKQGTGSNGFYVDVNDNGPGGGGAREARMRGYEAMTALATGTNAFPTSSQMSAGVICRKSTSADSTTRAWYCVADATCFHLFVDTGDVTSPSYSFCFSFGDFFSYKSGDTYNCQIQGRTTENNSSGSVESLPTLCGQTNALIALASRASFLARSWTGTAGSLAFSKHGALLSVQNGNTEGAMGGIPNTTGSAIGMQPNGPDGSIMMSPVFVGHNGAVRGYLKGIWAPLAPQPCGHTDTFSGTGNMAGKTFIALNVQSINNNGPQQGMMFVETSNTWS
ncbi:hypothetical protein ACS7SF_02935 [Ralstonia sp. 25C]|uniref:hypothetical protein n=1 Tax=Ralstonia sp. 25C TaxID=3447363 RepID=UPI003F750AB4